MDEKEFKPHEAVFKLVADKMFHEYLEMCVYLGGMDPEEFVENHIRKNFTYTNQEMVKAVWKYFMEDLLAYRKAQKKGQ